MRNAKPLILLTGCLLLLATCTPQQQVVKKQPVVQEEYKQVEVNPLEYDTADSGIVFTPVKRETARTVAKLPDDQYVVINVDKEAWEEEKKRSMSLAEDEEHKLGFRVQVYTSTILDTALAMKDSINSRFSLDVYLEHDAPYYKIRVGDYLDHDEATKIKDMIIGYGYKEAWVVRSEICHPCWKKRKGIPILADSTTVAPDSKEKP